MSCEIYANRSLTGVHVEAAPTQSLCHRVQCGGDDNQRRYRLLPAFPAVVDKQTARHQRSRKYLSRDGLRRSWTGPTRDEKFASSRGR